MKKVLIIGGNSYLAKSFIKTYHDSFSLKVLKRGEGLRDYFELSEDDFKGFDVVINFAAIVHDKSADEVSHKKYNFELVKYLSKLAKKAGVKHFIQISTIAVYGNKEYIDSNNSLKPVTPYGINKLKADEYLLSISDDRFGVSILRPPVIYGKDAPGNVLSLIKFLKLSLVAPFGYYKNRRSFLSIDNFINALYLILTRESKGVFLLRDKELVSIGELVSIILHELDKKAFIAPIPSFVSKIKKPIFSKLFGDLVIDDSITLEQLGEYRVISIRDSIKKMI
jgi:UDP-glucose 4-epimerase